MNYLGLFYNIQATFLLKLVLIQSIFMKKINKYQRFLIGLILIAPISLSAQEANKQKQVLSVKKNNIEFAVAGLGLGISVNYGHVVFVKPNYFLNVSVGVGSVPFAGGLSIPHQLTINYGKKSSFLELGIGGVYWTGSSSATAEQEKLYSYQITPIIGFRKHIKQHLILRVYVNPLFRVSGVSYYDNYDVIPYLGFSLGWAF